MRTNFLLWNTLVTPKSVPDSPPNTATDGTGAVHEATRLAVEVRPLNTSTKFGRHIEKYTVPGLKTRRRCCYKN